MRDSTRRSPKKQWQLLLHPPNPLHPPRLSVLEASPATLNAFAVPIPRLAPLARDDTLAAPRGMTVALALEQ